MLLKFTMIYIVSEVVELLAVVYIVLIFVEDHEEDAEAEWFRMAGLSDLVMSSSNTMLTSTDGTMLSHRGPDNLSSMTVLSTLTRPQREAVLRRISSFNRAQVQVI